MVVPTIVTTGMGVDQYLLLLRICVCAIQMQSRLRNFSPRLLGLLTRTYL